MRRVLEQCAAYKLTTGFVMLVAVIEAILLSRA